MNNKIFKQVEASADCTTELHREFFHGTLSFLHDSLCNSLSQRSINGNEVNWGIIPVEAQFSPPLKGGRGMTFLFLTSLFLLLTSLPTLTSAQDYAQTINRTIQFANVNDPDNELAVFNIHGSVTVEGYAGNEIQVKANQQLGGTAREINQAKDELKFVVEQEGNRVLIYIDAPFIQLRKREGQISYNINRWDDDYDFLYDITVQVPQRAHVRASTINNGKVIIRNTRGDVHASNVNGELELFDISGQTNASTVNGDITVRYHQSPRKDSKYSTVNGTIEVNYPENLSADIRFKSMHGDLYTDFQNIEHLQTQVEKDKRTRHSGVTYHIVKYAPIRIGNGGPTFSFEVLNGDVYVKRIQS